MSVFENKNIRLASGERTGFAVYGAPDGDPVLALHGAPASRLMFDVANDVCRELGLTLYCPDRPGYGQSDPSPNVSINDRVDKLSEFVERLEFDKFAILGISGGGPFAVALAAQFQDRVRALGLVSPMGPVAECMQLEEGQDSSIHFGHRVFFLRLPQHPILLRTNARIAAAAFLAAPHTFAKGFVATLPKRDQDILREPIVGESFLRMTKEALRQGVDGAIADLNIFSEPWQVDYQKISAPTVVWQGTADHIVPISASHFLAKKIPRSEYLSIDGYGHFWIYGHVGDMFRKLRAVMGVDQ